MNAAKVWRCGCWHNQLIICFVLRADSEQRAAGNGRGGGRHGLTCMELYVLQGLMLSCLLLPQLAVSRKTCAGELAARTAAQRAAEAEGAEARARLEAVRGEAAELRNAAAEHARC